MDTLEQYPVSGGNAREIAASAEAAIRTGDLAPGDRLPPVRSLAASLGVSPATVAAGYAQLRRRGLVTGNGRDGTRVSPGPATSSRDYLRPPAGTRDLISGAPDPALLPPLPARPAGQHARLYPGTPVAPRLREVAARQLSADGVDPAGLAVTGGALDAIERVLSGWLMPGDGVAVEDPGHVVTYDLVTAMGMRLVPVPVDEFGMRPDGLERALSSGVSAVIATPRAQAATGAAWDAGRARSLAGLLRAHPSAGLVEDDHAGPVAGVPGRTASAGLPRWAHIRSVSKSLGPDLRLAVLAGDETTISRVTGRQVLGTGWVSYQLQETVADLWETPGGVDRAATAYAERRDALRAALDSHGIAMSGRSGFTCWVPVPDEDRVVAGLASAGWAVAPGRTFRIASPSGIRICFATLEPRDAPAFAAAFAAALSPAPRRLD